MNDITKTLSRLTMYDGLVEFGTGNLNADPYSRQATTTAVPTGELVSVFSPTGIDEKTKELYRWIRGKVNGFAQRATYQTYQSEGNRDDEGVTRLIRQSRATLQNMLTDLTERREDNEVFKVMVDAADGEEENPEGEDTPSDELIDAFRQGQTDTHQVMVATSSQLNDTLIRSHRVMSLLQTDVRRLLDYQLQVQFKLDTTKIELLNRTYLLNLKYYKFAEKASLTQTAELRKMNHGKGARGLGSGLLDLLKGKGGFLDLLKNQLSNVVVAVERDLSKRLVDFAGRGNALLTKRYESYEEYLDDIIPKGQKPLPEAIFNRLNPRINQAASYLSQYTDVTLRGVKDDKLRIKKAIWSNRSDNTLNVIIPKLLDDIRYYTSNGKAKRGYDDPFAGIAKPIIPTPGGDGGATPSGQSPADAQRARQAADRPPDNTTPAEEKLVERMVRRVGEVNDKLRQTAKDGILPKRKPTPPDEQRTARSQGILNRQLDRMGRSLSNPVLRAVFQVAKNNPVLFASVVPLLVPGGLSTIVSGGTAAAGVAGGIYAYNRLRKGANTLGGLASQYRDARQQQRKPASDTQPVTDVYVRGETEPRLTKAGFEAGRYVHIDPATGTVHPYRHGNEIDPDYGVYEQGEDENDINMIVPPSLIRTKGLADATGKPVGKHGQQRNARQTATRRQKASYQTRQAMNNLGTPPQMSGSETPTDDTPHPRLNSLAYKEQQEAKEKQDNFYQDIHDIRDSLKSTDKDGKPKKGLVDKLIAGMTGAMGGLLFKALDWMLITPTKRLMKIGMVLFDTFLGPKSIMIRVLSKGFGLLMEAMLGRKLAGGSGGGLPGGKGGKGKASTPKKAGKVKQTISKAGSAIRRGPGRLSPFTKLIMGGALMYGGEAVASGMMDNLMDDNQDDTYDGQDDTLSGQDDTDANSLMTDRDDSPTAMDTIGDGLSIADTAVTTAEVAKLAGGALGVGALATRIGGGTLPGTGGIAGTTKAGGKATSAAAKVASHVPGAMGLGGRVLARANPILLGATALYDGATGFMDDDRIRNTFNNAPGTDIKTTQRLASAAGNILDLGGLGSWAGEGLADLTGIEALRPDGSITRGIEKGFDIWSKIPGLNTPFIALDYLNDKLNERTSDDAVWMARLAMYGVGKLDSDLAKTIAKTEAQLAEFVIFNEATGGIKISPKAPYQTLLAPFCTVDKQAGQAWFITRFLPVWQLWQSALRVAGFKDLESYDKSATTKTLTVAEQVYSAMVQLHPYPLDVVVKISNTVGLLPREDAEGVIRSALKQLGDKVSDGKGITNDNTAVTKASHIPTLEETANGESQADTFMGKVNRFVKKQAYAFDEYLSPTPVEVKEIDITDLHEGEKTTIDDITLVRLGVYGNTQNDALRVDTVLRLERYCEAFCRSVGDTVTFSEPVEKIYALFAPAFRQTQMTKNAWFTWFTRRFLPVLKSWYQQVYQLRNVAPVKGWQTLTDTNKFDIAHTLVSLQIVSEDKKSMESIWIVEESPFPGLKSGTDAKEVDGYLSNLETKVTRAKLKGPEAEKRLSKPLNAQNSVDNQLTPEERQRRLELLARASGGNGNALSNSPGSASSYMAQYAKRTAGDAMPEFTQNSNTYDASYLAADTKEGFTVEKETAIKAIIKAFTDAGLTDPRILAFALANAHSETNFTGRTESLNYTPEALKETFLNFRQHPADAERYGRTADHPANEQAIANIAYGGRIGNNREGDGYKYRGRGYTQLTGRSNYAAVAKAIGDPEIVEHPEKVGQDPVYAAKSAAGFFKINPNIVDNILKGNIQKAAELVGTEKKGVARKMSYFPDYYRRLTEGDLKGLLGQQAADSAPEQEDSPPVTAGQPTPTEATPESQMAEDAMGKTNVSPDAKDSTTSASQKEPAAPATPPGKGTPPTTDSPTSGQSPQVDLARPGQPAPTPVRPSAPTTQPEETPAQTKPPASTSQGKKQPDKPIQVALPDQILNVNDEGVKQAINQLAVAINNLAAKQTGQAGGIDRRVNVGKR